LGRFCRRQRSLDTAEAVSGPVMFVCLFEADAAAAAAAAASFFTCCLLLSAVVSACRKASSNICGTNIHQCVAEHPTRPNSLVHTKVLDPVESPLARTF